MKSCIIRTLTVVKDKESKEILKQTHIQAIFISRGISNSVVYEPQLCQIY